MDYDAIITGVLGLLGGGVAKAAIDGWNRRSLKRIEVEAEDAKRDDARKDNTESKALRVLEGALTEERRRHGECLARVAAVEVENRELRRQVSVMHGALISYFTDPEPDRETLLRALQSIRPSRP